jgi:Zinc carboxypeptidase
MSIEEQTKTLDGYESTMKIVTVEPGGLTNDHSNKARFIVNFGEHGRELISPEIGLRLLETLCDDGARRELLIAYGISSDIVDSLLNNVVFKIIPLENPRGRGLVEDGALCERKNGRGVDPNRNWKVHWGFKEADYDPNEEFPGSKPFSEPEVAILQALAESFQPHVWLNVHSGMEAMFLPYDHKNEVPKGPAADATLAILNKLNKDLCNGTCAVGPGGKTVGYLAHGTATDYMHDELGVGVVMTWEVYGDDDASFEDCFRMFNPLTKDGYTQVVDQWTAAVFALVAALPGHPAIPELNSKILLSSGETINSNISSSNTDTNNNVKESASGSALGRKGGGGIDMIQSSKVVDEENNSSKDLIDESGIRGDVGSFSIGGGYLPSASNNVASFAVLGIACVAFALYASGAGTRRGILGSLRMGRRRQAIPV